MDRRFTRVLTAGGMIAPLLWAAAVIYCGSLRPEYSHYRQYVSELAARGSSTQRLMQIAGFMLPGLMVVGFGTVIGTASRTLLPAVGASLVIVSGVARIIAGAFPADPCCPPMAPSLDQQIHSFAGAVYVLTISCAALVWVFAARRMFGTGAGWFRWFSLATAGLAVTIPLVLIRMGLQMAAISASFSARRSAS